MEVVEAVAVVDLEDGVDQADEVGAVVVSEVVVSEVAVEEVVVDLEEEALEGAEEGEDHQEAEAEDDDLVFYYILMFYLVYFIYYKTVDKRGRKSILNSQQKTKGHWQIRLSKDHEERSFFPSRHLAYPCLVNERTRTQAQAACAPPPHHATYSK